MHLATRSSLSQSRRSPRAYSPPTPLPSGLACGGSQPLRCQHHGLGPSMSQRGIVDSTHCFEVQLWRGEGDAGSRAQPRRNGETPPLKPREPKGWLLCRYMDMSFRAGNLFFVLLFCAIVVFGVAIL